MKRLGPNNEFVADIVVVTSYKCCGCGEVGREAGEVIYTKRAKPAFCGYKQDYYEAKTCNIVRTASQPVQNRFGRGIGVFVHGTCVRLMLDQGGSL